MSLSTTHYQTEAGPTPVLTPRRIRRRNRRRRGWIAIGALLAILLTAGGGYLAYANSLPTSVSLNIKNGQKDVPTFTKLVFTFSRPVAQTELEAALTITPEVDGIVSSVSGQTEYQWSPRQPLADLTTYTVSLKPIIDVGHHRIAGIEWAFTTNIIPRIASVTGPGGVQLGEGSEILPGTVLTLNFNDAMDTSTISVSMRSKPATLKWAADSRSATIATAGLPSGPLALELAPGGRDQTGHQMAGSFGTSSCDRCIVMT